MDEDTQVINFLRSACAAKNKQIIDLQAQVVTQQVKITELERQLAAKAPDNPTPPV